MDHSIPQLTARVRDLERRVRRLVAAAGLSGLMLVLAATAPRQTQDLLRAHRIQLVDSDGRVRLDLRHDSTETGLFILDGAGDVRLGAAQFSHGGGGYALHGPGGRGAAVLYLRGDGSLTMYDAEGNTTARFPPLD